MQRVSPVINDGMLLRPSKPVSPVANDAMLLRPSTTAECLVYEDLLETWGWLPQPMLRLLRFIVVPSILVELVFKLAVALVLYGLLIGFSIQGAISAANREPQISQEVYVNGGDRHLHVELTACSLLVSSGVGSFVRITGSTLTSPFQSQVNQITIKDTGTCIVVTCMGPSTEVGYLTSAHLEIGDASWLNSTSVEVTSGASSTLLMGAAAYGDQLSVQGDSLILQLDSINASLVAVSVNTGFLDIRRSPVPAMELSLGAATLSIHTSPSVGTRLEMSVTGIATAETIVNSLCLSDLGGIPVMHSNGSTYFDFGDTKVSSIIKVTRGGKNSAKIGEVFVSHGVSQLTRSLNNTYDSTAGSSFVLQDGVGKWAEEMKYSEMQLLRLRILGPGLDDNIGGISATGEWIYSKNGDVLIWHSSSTFWLATASLFSPQTARTNAFFSSGLCTPLTPQASTSASVRTAPVCHAAEQVDVKMDLGAMHKAIWAALPAHMQLRNETTAELYYVKPPLVEPEFVATDLDSAFFSLSQGSVTKFTTSSLVSFTAHNDSAAFQDAKAIAFLVMRALVMTVMPLLATIFLARAYVLERDKILAAQGKLLWPILWHDKLRRAETRALNGFGGAPRDDAGDAGPSGDVVVPLQVPIAVPSLPASPSGTELQQGAAGVEGSAPTDGIGASTPGPTSTGQGNVATQMASDLASRGEPDGPWFHHAHVSFGSVDALRIIRLKMTDDAKEVHKYANKLVSNGNHFFRFVDGAVLSQIIRPDRMGQPVGLPRAFISVVTHFSVVLALCFPLYLAACLQLWQDGKTDLQTACALVDMVAGKCLIATRTRVLTVLILLIIVELFFCFFTMIEYLSRQVDQIILDEDASNVVSVHRRRLLRISSSRLFVGTFWFFVTLLLFGAATYLTTFVAYIIMATCIEPDRLLPLLVGVFAVAFAAKETFDTMSNMAADLRKQILAMPGMGEDALAEEEALEAVMRDMGFNRVQIFLITVMTCIVFTAFIAFVLLGSALFISPGNIMPTLLSSGMVILPVLAVLRSGNLPDSYATGNHKVTKSLNKHLSQWKDVTAKTDALITAKNAQDSLSAADKAKDIPATIKKETG